MHYNSQNLLARSLHENGYQHNPGFLRFIEQTGLTFKPHKTFRKADTDERQRLYRQLAEQIWSPDRLEREAFGITSQQRSRAVRSPYHKQDNSFRRSGDHQSPPTPGTRSDELPPPETRSSTDLPRDYQALNTKGLALCGLATSGDSHLVQDAIDAFRFVRRITCPVNPSINPG